MFISHPHKPVPPRLRRYGDLAERLIANTVPDPDGSECRFWIGRYVCGGYGKINVRENGRWITKRVHRVSYEVFVGPIEPGMTIEHVCKVPFCIWPAHLLQLHAGDNFRGSRGCFAKGGGRVKSKQAR